MGNEIRSGEEVNEGLSDLTRQDRNQLASEIEVGVRSTRSRCDTGAGLDLNEERSDFLHPVTSEADNNEKSSSSISGEDSRCTIGEDDNFGGMSEISLNLLASVGNESLSNLVVSETLNDMGSAERRCSIGKDDFLEVVEEDSSNLVASGAAGNESSPYLMTSESVNDIRSAESRCSTCKDDGLEETDENSLNSIAINTLGDKNSSILVTLETLTEVRFAESRCSTRKNNDLEEIGESSLNSVNSRGNKNSSNLVTLETPSVERRHSSGKNNDLQDTGENSLNSMAVNSPGNEISPNLFISETPNVVTFAESRRSSGKNNGLEDTGENSLNSVAINAVGRESLSNLVALETPNEIRFAEKRCPGKDGDMEDIGENSSKLVVALKTAVVVQCTETECLDSENSVSKSNTNLLGGNITNDKMKGNVPDPMKDSCVVIDVKGDNGGLDNGTWDGENVCRICHLSSDHQSDASDIIQLGCHCKDELGIAHRHCAEAWFRLKGNRWCEICGQSAKNITGVGESRIVELWNERRMVVVSRSSPSERGRCWRVQPFCNFLMACLVVAFVLPWFFRVNMF